MSPKTLGAFVVLLGLAAVGLWWLGGREEAGEGSDAAARPAAPTPDPEQDADQAAVLDRPQDTGDPDRRAEDLVETPLVEASTETGETPPPAIERAPRELLLPFVDVIALTSEGEPLAPALGESFGRLELSASASTLPFGDALVPRPAGGLELRSAVRRDPWSVPGEPGLVARLELLAEPPLWVALTFGTRVLASAPVNLGEERVVFRLDPEEVRAQAGVLTFQVVELGTGRPVPDAAVMVSTVLDGMFARVDVDGEGWVRVDPWPAGPSVALVSTPTCAQNWFDLHVLAGQVSDCGPLQIPPGVALEGVVLDAEGQPLVDAQVQAYPVTQGQPALIPPVLEDGSFSLQLAPGRWGLRAFLPAGNSGLAIPPVELELADGRPPGRIELRARPAAPFVLDATAPWARRATFVVRTPGGPVLRSGNLVRDPLWQDVLPLGPYDVELLAPDGEVLQRVELDHDAAGTRVTLDRL